MINEMTPERADAVRNTLAKHPQAESAQGGGLVVYNEATGEYNFVLTPEHSDYKVGDTMPRHWGTCPVWMALFAPAPELTESAKLHQAMEAHGDHGWGF